MELHGLVMSVFDVMCITILQRQNKLPSVIRDAVTQPILAKAHLVLLSGHCGHLRQGGQLLIRGRQHGCEAPKDHMNIRILCLAV